MASTLDPRGTTAALSQGEMGIDTGGRRHVAVIAAVAAIGGFLFGYDTAIINGAVGAIQDQFNTSAALTGFAVSAALIGSAIGAWYAGRLADRYGRVQMMKVAALLFLASSVGAGLAIGIYDFMWWRFVGGVGVGVASVIGPTYVAEVAPSDLRGRLGSLQQLAIVLGIFAALLVDYALAEIAGSASDDLWLGRPAWRWMFLTEAIPAIVYFFGSFRIPKSPRFLMMKGKDKEAQAVLETIGDPDPVARVEIIRSTLSSKKTRLSDLRVDGKLLPVVWIGIGLAVFQQFVGINVIFYYSSVLWNAVGFSESDSLLITVITSVVNIVTTLIAIAYVDRFGRKPLLLIGSIGMAISLSTLAIIFGTAPLDSAGDPNLGNVAGPLALVAANVFVFFFGMSWGPVVWVLLGEMFPNRIRAVAISVATAFNWMANFAISTTFPVLKDASLGIAYGIYAVSAILSIFFVLKFVPETKGMSLEEMGDDPDHPGEPDGPPEPAGPAAPVVA